MLDKNRKELTALTIKLKQKTDKKQRGVFIMASVLMLLGISAFTLASISAAVNRHKIMKSTTSTAKDSYTATKNELRRIGSQLRVVPISSIKSTNTNISHTILTSNYEGANSQPLKVFDVTVTYHDSHFATEMSQRFLHYPAILNIPSVFQSTSSDTNITQWLFNRSVSTLTAKYFPLSNTTNECVDLKGATMHWVTGDCELNYNDVDHSSASTPMLLIVEDGDVLVTAGTPFYGMIIMLSGNTTKHSATIEHGASIQGALCSNTPISLQQFGSNSYAKQVLLSLQKAPKLAKIMSIPGSWSNNLKKAL